MSLVWDIQDLTSSQKIILLSLADQSNDDGMCWPSATLTSKRTGLCERSTRSTIADLEKLGHLSRRIQTGKATIYRIHPCIKCTPASDAPLHLAPVPLHLTALTPASDSNITVSKPKEPSLKDKDCSPAKAVVLVNSKSRGMDLLKNIPDLSEQVARDFLIVRNAKKSPLTETALAGIAREAKKAGMTLADAITMATGMGWQGFKAEWVNKQATGGGFIEQHTDRSWREGLGGKESFVETHTDKSWAKGIA